jgi:hypothetical protein
MQVQQLYAEITARIIEGLEQGVKPWQRDWDADVPLALPRNAVTGKEYRGSNVLWLWFVREQCGFAGHGSPCAGLGSVLGHVLYQQRQTTYRHHPNEIFHYSFTPRKPNPGR